MCTTLFAIKINELNNNNRRPNEKRGCACTECCLLSSLPVYVPLLLTRQGVHSTSCSNLPFPKSGRWLIPSARQGISPLTFIKITIRMANPVWLSRSHIVSPSRVEVRVVNPNASSYPLCPRVHQNLAYMTGFHVKHYRIPHSVMSQRSLCWSNSTLSPHGIILTTRNLPRTSGLIRHRTYS